MNSPGTNSGPRALNLATPQCLQLLASRRSGSAKAIREPGPLPEQLRTILACGVRVPDHGKLAPWRFIVFRGTGRDRMGELLAGIIQQTEPDASPERLAIERNRFLRAPVVVGVISRVREGIAIPEWEQILSAGASCMSILVAAHAMGFVANWITEWCAFHPLVREGLGMKCGERIAGFIYIGTPAVPPVERVRPNLDSLVVEFA